MWGTSDSHRDADRITFLTIGVIAVVIALVIALDYFFGKGLCRESGSRRASFLYTFIFSFVSIRDFPLDCIFGIYDTFWGWASFPSGV